MRVHLWRCAYTPHGTFGVLEIPSLKFRAVSIESPWHDNVPFKSCVPEDEYELVPHTFKEGTNQEQKTWAMVGPTVSHYASMPKKPRYACLCAHIGNTRRSVTGCVALGEKPRMYGDLWGVGRSTEITNEYNRLLYENGDRHELLITFRRMRASDWFGGEFPIPG